MTQHETTEIAEQTKVIFDTSGYQNWKVQSELTANLNLKFLSNPLQIYELWSQIREMKLKEELDRVDLHDRLNKIDALVQEMTEQEEKLWFFENESKIDLELEKISSVVTKTQKISKRQQKLLDEAYVPPEVDAKRN